MTAVLYSLPLLFAALRYGHLIHVFYPDEAYYAARVLDASRGGTLGNPYLAGHENAPKYLPEATERFFAGFSRMFHFDPLTVLAGSRVVVPVLLVLALAGLARSLGLERRLAAWSAASVAILPPVLTLLQPAGAGEHGFLRLFRIVSPGCHMLLLALVFRAVVEARRRGTVGVGAAAGFAIALLLFTPIYYPAFAAAGTALLAISEGGRTRRVLSIAFVTAALLSVPFWIHELQLAKIPEVGQTLGRLGLMLPGRTMEREVARRFFENLAALGILRILRKRIGQTFRFVFAFLVAGECLLVQNALTNRQVQAFHWMHCLFLIWPLAAAAVWQSFRFRRKRFWLGVFVSIAVLGAALAQAIAFAHWEEHRAENPERYTLNFVMPRTLEWLNVRTAPGSIVLSSEDVMASLPLFTRNKVYWAEFAGQHVLSDRDVEQRRNDAAAWNETGQSTLHFRADYCLLKGSACSKRFAPAVIFRDSAEQTCVVKLR